MKPRKALWLTAREAELLTYLKKYSPVELCRLLNIKDGTVFNMMRRVREKAGFHNQDELWTYIRSNPDLDSLVDNRYGSTRVAILEAEEDPFPTELQLDILMLRLEGKGSFQVSEHLGIPHDEVMSELRSIYHTLQVPDWQGFKEGLKRQLQEEKVTGEVDLVSSLYQGPGRLHNLPPEERREFSRKGAEARWGRRE